MSYEDFEAEVLARPGASARVAELEHRIVLVQRLAAARRRAKVSQREVAKRLGVSQPRVAAIERAEDLNLSTLSRYAEAIGGEPVIEIVVHGEHFALTPTATPPRTQRRTAKPRPRPAS